MIDYQQFLESKRKSNPDTGFEPDVSKFPLQMFDFQRDCCAFSLRKGRSALFLGTGLGKCHGKGTKILMYDGSIKNVEDVKVGDQLMGPDSKPRNVLSLARGVDEMFLISPIKGDSWTCNKSHVLSLKVTADKNEFKKDQIVNIPLDEYLQKNKTFKHIMKMWRTGVEFGSKPVSVDPYILGVWLGDGTKISPSITNSDPEIIYEINKFADLNELYIRKSHGNNTIMHHLASHIRGRANKGSNVFRNFIKTCVIDGEKRVPKEYLVNDEVVRLQVLAGLIDTDGYLIDKVYEIATKYEGLKDDIVFLARSLGLAATWRVKVGTIKSLNFEGNYYRIFISGNTDMIPCKVKRRITEPRLQKKNVLKTGFKVIPQGVGEYYGFELDGDHLYLLGDFTVTHNTICQLVWADQVCNHTGGDVLILAPLAVAPQTVREGQKFGISVNYCRGQSGIKPGINITNYEMLEHFDTHHFKGVVLDESSCIKCFSGKVRNQIIDSFCRTQYKLSCTATPSPNDHMELGNQCEFLGIMNYSEMLATYFVHDGGDTSKWRVKGHAVEAFWQWVASWAVMMQNPRDLGYDGSLFDLPPLNLVQHTVTPKSSRFQGRGVAKTLNDRRDARRESLNERVAKAAEIVNGSDETWLVWCDLNVESEQLSKMIPGSVEVRGSDKPEYKEKTSMDFCEGKIKVLVSKPSIFGMGLNYQHCHNMIFVGLSDCYDENTELLTMRGWLKFSDVRTDDMVATVNPENKMFEWQHPSRVIYEKYIGDMIHFKSNTMDLLVTPNHKVYVKRPESRYRTECNGYELKYASDIADNYMRQGYSMMSTPQGGVLSIPLDDNVDIPVNPNMRLSTRSRLITSIKSDDYIRLIGWYVTEGYCRPLKSQEAGRIAICQSDKNEGKNRAEIIELMKRIGLHVNDNGINVTGYSYNLAEYLLHECGTSSYDMRIPIRLKNASKEQLILLRDTILKGDGCHTNGVPRFLRTASKQLADDFQEICIKTGMRATVHKREYTSKNYPDKSCYDVSITFKRNEPAIHKIPDVIKYDGMIGCVEVPNHIIIVRRNGIPIVSGNSFESLYQAIRRCWRFGQNHQVNVHVITSEAEGAVVQNIKEKEKRFNEMLSGMISASQEITKENIRGSYRMSDEYNPQEKMVVPSWI